MGECDIDADNLPRLNLLLSFILVLGVGLSLLPLFRLRLGCPCLSNILINLWILLLGFVSAVLGVFFFLLLLFGCSRLFLVF